MTYLTQDTLIQDPLFGARVRACCLEQSETYKDDARAPFVALAADVARGNGALAACFTRLLAVGPGIADKATGTDDNGEPDVDQARITDEDILASVQLNWPLVAALYFDEEGQPR